MEYVLEFLIALVAAIVLSVLLVVVLRRRGPGPWSGLLFFFLIVLLAAWAGGAWLVPVGPPLAGIYWLGFLLVGIAVAVILAAATPAQTRREAAHEDAPEATGAIALGLFFYIAMFALLLAIILSFFVREPYT